jgi:hypothetical protein
MIGDNPFPDELWNPSPEQIRRERLEDRRAREAVGLRMTRATGLFRRSLS